MWGEKRLWAIANTDCLEKKKMFEREKDPNQSDKSWCVAGKQSLRRHRKKREERVSFKKVLELSYYLFRGMPGVVVCGNTPALKKLRQEVRGFSSSPNYIVRPFLKKKNQCDYIFNCRKEKCIFWGGEWKGRNCSYWKSDSHTLCLVFKDPTTLNICRCKFLVYSTSCFSLESSLSADEL